MKILFAKDNSVYSGYALEMLGQLPVCQQVDLDLVTVIAKLPNPDLVPAEQNAVKQLLEQRSEVLARRFRSVSIHTPHGSPGIEITRLAKEENADLIVLGAIGQSAIARVLLGSVSEHVATRSDCSVLVVRPPAVAPTEELPKPKLPRHVLIAIGQAESDGRLAQWVREVELPTETEVHLMHVIETGEYYDLDLLRKASAYWKEMRSTAARHIEAMQADLQSAGYVVHTNIADAPHIGQALVDDAAKKNCELVVSGDHQGTLIDRILLGSTSRYLLRHSTCSVLIAR
ncbi:MAG: universal stress protein [Rubripirellula sp.]